MYSFIAFFVAASLFSAVWALWRITFHLERIAGNLAGVRVELVRINRNAPSYFEAVNEPDPCGKADNSGEPSR